MALPAADSIGFRPLASIEPTRSITPLGDIRQESIDRLARLEIGKQFQGQILSRFDDGTFMIRIANASARIALPDGGQVGDNLQLTLLTTSPRPTFSLDAHTTNTSLTQETRNAQALYLSTAPEQMAVIPPEAAIDDGAASAALSVTGKLIVDLLGKATEAGASTSLLGTVPLLERTGTGTAIGVQQLATALQETLAYSGLFYESHVYQWANGERSLTDLLREPQAKGSKVSGSDAPNTPARMLDLPPEVMDTRRSLLEYFSSAPLSGNQPDMPLGLDPGTSQMVNLQLNTLEQQRVRWQGELWPGLPFEWEVGRDDQSTQPDTEDASQQQWQSMVRFNLPTLGTVAATLHLQGNRVHIQIRTDSEDSATALRRYAPKLASAMDAAGTNLDTLLVRRQDTSHDTT